ncbi:hypothetical protein [Rhodococcus sp. 077-4]|uniref:hypothetical protein n=1 Tax=Rhodococcus sp. 077-4 TaxID=2789271 RepID=UPI0039F5FC93
MKPAIQPVRTSPEGARAQAVRLSRSEIPRYITVSAWAVPTMVLGQFAMLALIPVGVVLVGTLRNKWLGSLRLLAGVLTAAYIAPLVVWALRENPAGSLSKDIDTPLVVLVVAASAGLIMRIWTLKK